MCIPLPAIQAAGVAASTIQSAFGASSQEDAQAEAFKETQRLAHAQAADDYFQLSLRQSTEASRVNQQIQGIDADAAEAIAAASVSAAEAGVSGNAVAALTQEFQRDQGESVALALRNKHIMEVQLQAEKEAVYTRTEAAIFGSTPPPVSQPDYIGALFQIGGIVAKDQRRKDSSANQPGSAPPPAATINTGGSQ